MSLKHLLFLSCALSIVSANASAADNCQTTVNPNINNSNSLIMFQESSYGDVKRVLIEQGGSGSQDITTLINYDECGVVSSANISIRNRGDESGNRVNRYISQYDGGWKVAQSYIFTDSTGNEIVLPQDDGIYYQVDAEGRIVHSQQVSFIDNTQLHVDTDFNYSSAGLLMSEELSNQANSKINYSYDKSGRLSGITSADKKTTITLDRKGRQVKQVSLIKQRNLSTQETMTCKDWDPIGNCLQVYVQTITQKLPAKKNAGIVQSSVTKLYSYQYQQQE